MRLAAGAVVFCLSVGCVPMEPWETPDGSVEETDAGVPAGDAGASTDLDVSLARFLPTGALDTTFGSNGVATVNFGPGEGNTRDSLWSVRADAQNRLVLFGSKKAENRTDTDRVVARLTASGQLDTSFATHGFHTLNVGNLNEQARAGLVQADGKIVATGYVSTPTGVGAQAANRVLTVRLNDDGKPDNSFGYQGVSMVAPFQPADPVKQPWGMAEAYGLGLQSSGKYLTTGYGRVAATGQVDVVTFRYLEDGTLDPSFGTNGGSVLDVAGQNDRGRDLAILPDDRVVVVGSAISTASEIDAMVLVLTPDGVPDTTFSPDGYKLYSFDRPNQELFGAAVSPSGTYFAAVGYRTGGNEDDDAILVIRSIAGGTEFAQAVPLSESAHDRFWGLAFDANDKVYAAGFLDEGGDSRSVVVRFNPDGSRDTSFGTGGVAMQNVAKEGKLETARSVLVAPDGKVIIAGVSETPSVNQ